MEFDDVMEKVTLRQGRRGNPSPTNIDFCQAWVPKSPLPGGGWRRQAAGGERATQELVFVSDTAHQTLGATTG